MPVPDFRESGPAGRGEYAASERNLRARAERDWDGPALKRAVMLSQPERLIVNSMREYGGAPQRDYDSSRPGPVEF